MSDETVKHHPACDQRVCACAAFEILQLRADLAAARAEVERLKVDAMAEAKRELVADVLSKTPEDVKERVRLYTQRRLADLRERCARVAEENSEWATERGAPEGAYIADNIVEDIRALPLVDDGT